MLQQIVQPLTRQDSLRERKIIKNRYSTLWSYKQAGGRSDWMHDY